MGQTRILNNLTFNWAASVLSGSLDPDLVLKKNKKISLFVIYYQWTWYIINLYSIIIKHIIYI